MSELPEEMTQAGYATLRGVSRQDIFDKIKRGKIPASAIRVGDDGTKWINVAAADFALNETRERVDVRDVPIEALPGDAKTIAEIIEGDAADDDVAPVVVPGHSSTARLTDAKATSESYRAKIAELEYHKRLGELVPIAEVTAAAQLAAEKTLGVIKQLSTRAEEIASAGVVNGVHGVRSVLKTIERDAAKQLAEAFGALAAVAVEPAAGEFKDAAE